jgi:hypothetical protein
LNNAWFHAHGSDAGADIPPRYGYRREGTDGHIPGDACGNTFLEFSKNSDSMRQLCPNEACCTYVKPLQRWVPSFVDVHINDQSHCVFLPGGESLVDYIGATETIEDDWVEIVAAINKRTGLKIVAKAMTNPNGMGQKANGGIEHGCMMPDVRALFNGTTLRNIARQYAMDVLRYGYL